MLKSEKRSKNLKIKTDVINFNSIKIFKQKFISDLKS